ncbi:15187_t:CDS:2 [Funneliformis geosporum]|uniref:15187_t:CDS:1 n=1 Tax=Funneliformis geosporum TaxID=1117311 RepID=A0A9W4SU05_9GLOM|nr:15187_t:CDS:2 [Funneliformis geosporum]
MNWFTNLFKGKTKQTKMVEKDNRKFRELYAHLNYLIQNEGKNKSEAQLEVLQEVIKEFNLDRQRIIERYERDRKQYKEQEEQRHISFVKSMKDSDKLKNQLYLMLDVCKRELEIMKLNKGLSLIALPDDREVILKKIGELNKINSEIEKVLLNKKIDAKIQILEDYQEKEKGEFAKYVKEHGSELERELLDLVFIQEKVFRDSRLLIEKLKKQNFLLQKENKRKDHSNYILTILA